MHRPLTRQQYADEEEADLLWGDLHSPPLPRKPQKSEAEQGYEELLFRQASGARLSTRELEELDELEGEVMWANNSPSFPSAGVQKKPSSRAPPRAGVQKSMRPRIAMVFEDEVVVTSAPPPKPAEGSGQTAERALSFYQKTKGVVPPNEELERNRRKRHAGDELEHPGVSAPVALVRQRLAGMSRHHTVSSEYDLGDIGEVGEIEPDAEENPYRDTDILYLDSDSVRGLAAAQETGDARDKVIFLENGHMYALRDRKGIYPSLIVSGSNVIKYLSAYKKTVVEDKGTLYDTTRFLRDKGFGPGKNLLQRMEMLRARFAGYCIKLNALLWERPDTELPLSYAERANILSTSLETFGLDVDMGKTTKQNSDRDVHYFFPSFALDALEYEVGGVILDRSYAAHETSLRDPVHIGRVQRALQPFLPSDESWRRLPLTIRTALGNLGFPEGGRRRMSPRDEDAFTVKLLTRKAGLPTLRGTALHQHIEQRLLGVLDRETIVRQFPLAEREELRQIDSFLSAYPPGTFRYMEYRVGSLRHKICGSVDAIRVHPPSEETDGEEVWQIYDWKRTPYIFGMFKSIKLNDGIGRMTNDKIEYRDVAVAGGASTRREYFVNYENIGRSDDIYTYMIQLATYRHLCVMNGARVSKVAYLVVFHPMYEDYRALRVELDRPCKASLEAPVDFVARVLKERERHLRDLYRRKGAIPEQASADVYAFTAKATESPSASAQDAPLDLDAVL